MSFRSQWSLRTLLINQNGNDSYYVSRQVPNLIASLPRPTQELACEEMQVQQIGMAQRPLPYVAAVFLVRDGWRDRKV